MALAVPPAGTFAPGTKVQVGNHRVVIEKYLSEGGFAHVYVVRLPHPIDGAETAVLKRVAVPDKVALANMRTEVETMKKLKGHRHIVTYFDSHASQLKGGGYEVFLLMEFCAGGGLIDFMNTRLQNRLTEPEILKIFTDVAEGTACMHYLKPPLLHRDLKVENVLIALHGNSFSYKLCDFGSAAPPRPAAATAAEGRLIEDDVQRHTTLQYRSPEMIDVYRKQPIDEKSDIWALGVLLYKLCYYTTPFEEAGQMAILNAKFKYPAYPPFSDRLKLLIASMLREDPRKRPNIYQVLQEACRMRGKEVPITDIYSGRSHSESRRYQKLPPSPNETPKIGAVFSPPIQETQIIPDIAPMRRGRPTKPTSHHNSTKPSPSPLRVASSDPFAALDGGKVPNGDELSSRFPTLDEFSLFHDQGSKFEFEPTVPETKPPTEDLSKRITNALADEAFAKANPTPVSQKNPAIESQSKPLGENKPLEEKILIPSPDLRAELTRQQTTTLHQPIPQKPVMVSTGTMTTPSPRLRPLDSPPFSQRSKSRLPNSLEKRHSAQQFESENEKTPSGRDVYISRGAFFKRESKQNASFEDLPRSPVSSRPSLEGSRPSALDTSDPTARSKSANSKSRPASSFIGSRSERFRDFDSPRDSLDSSFPRGGYDGSDVLHHPRLETDRDHERANISSDIDFLRAKEVEESNRKREKRVSSGSKHMKRSSLTSISLSGTKNLLAGRFGDAFRRFENNAAQERTSRSPSPDNVNARLTPITGSEVTEMSDDGCEVNDGDISPEMRRELERRRLSLEERRVANAAAEYRQRLAERGEDGARGGGRIEGVRAASIQSKVQSLLKENDRHPTVKTASGYGRYTDTEAALQAKQFEQPSIPPRAVPFNVPRKPVSIQQQATEQAPRPQPKDPRSAGPLTMPIRSQQPTPSEQFVSRASTTAADQKPPAPPKPQNLRTGNRTENVVKEHNPPIEMAKKTSQNDDWEANFSKRYPSLSGLELVETEIDIPTPRVHAMRTKEV
ncbi:serine/threonine protein kinase ppk30 [Histoplasma capsulatum var. duboisii H88]|uniref:non-specific serine/threonine protein kinase n=1 Tax=Ajellomyces capsulatus (strain H88) TaxID=544711 RepID=F0U8Z2_AJEC8|nr:serine/threonine protein kinase ppk30 [Histoplasma capsulatum var. duboisii H88]QSS52572.1 protein kinase [Histoplasma capsulatum var. duboisii H88]